MIRLPSTRIPRAGLFLLAALAWSQLALAQSGPRVVSVEIPSLTPFSVVFDVENRGGVAISIARGIVTLSDDAGRDVDEFSVEPLAVSSGGLVHVRTASRWDFQLAGTYLVRVVLDVGTGALVTGSLKLEIRPVRLPLAPQDPPADGNAYVVYQTPSNWGLARMRVPEAWELSHGASSVVVAVIDSGIDATVPQLIGSMWTNEDEVPNNGKDDDQNGYVDDIHGWDFRDSDSTSLAGSEIHRHGTFVGSIIAARPGRYPVVGVAPGVRLMDVRFLDSQNQFTTEDWGAFERAVDYAADNGADIINLSIFANSRPPTSFERALERARSKGILIVGISGNRGDNAVMYPGRYDSVVAVSAVAVSGLVATFSNQGSEVDFCAPGESIPSFTPGGRVATEAGTSLAAAHVTGVLALMLSLNLELTADAAIRILAETAVDLGSHGRDDLYGYGLVDARAALLAASER